MSKQKTKECWQISILVPSLDVGNHTIHLVLTEGHSQCTYNKTNSDWKKAVVLKPNQQSKYLGTPIPNNPIEVRWKESPVVNNIVAKIQSTTGSPSDKVNIKTSGSKTSPSLALAACIAGFEPLSSASGKMSPG